VSGQRWRVLCGCGYVVENLTHEQAERFANQHRDDEHEVSVALMPGTQREPILTDGERRELLNGHRHGDETERQRIVRAAERIAADAERRGEQRAEAKALALVNGEMAESRARLWQSYLNAPGGALEALRQGKFDGFVEALGMLRAALSDPDALARIQAEAWDEAHDVFCPRGHVCSTHLKPGDRHRLRAALASPARHEQDGEGR